MVHRRVSILAARLAITGGLAAVAPVGCGVVPLDPPGLEGPGASQGTPTPRGAQAAPPAAPGGEFQPETGPYVGGSVVYNYIEGDFDGNRTLVSQGGPNQVTIAIPSVDPGFGGRLSGGWRWSQAKLELAVMQSHHDDHFNGVENSAIYTTYDMNGYYYLPTPWSHVKPNVMGGFALPSIDLNHASTDGTFTGDGRMYGYGFNLGGGADIYVTRNLSIDALIFYHWTRFDTAKGVSTGYHTIHGGDIAGDGWTFSLGAAWTF